MLRDDINNALKEAMKAKDERKVSTLRLVNSTFKNADIEARASGKTLADAESAACEAMIGAHFEGGVPVIAVSCPEFDAVRLGELFYFFELSNAICACTNGIEPYDPAPRPALAEAEKLLGKPEA